MDIEEAILHACDGNSLLFCGAGFSCEAKNRANEKIKTSKALQDIMKTKLAIEEDCELSTISDIYRKEFGVNELMQLLENEFIIGDFDQKYMAIADIPWRAIFTTNYDDLLENILTRKSIKYTTSILDDEPTRKNSLQICHINGYIQRLTRQTIQSRLKLTHESYLTEIFMDSPWSVLFRELAHYAKSVIFIGYSLYDIDVRRSLALISGIQDKTVFITNTESKGFSTIAENFGSIYSTGVLDFLERIPAVRKNHVPSSASSILFRNFKKSDKITQSKLAEPSDNDVFNFLLHGDFNVQYLSRSIINNDSKTCISRSELSKLLRKVKEGVSNFAIHSSIGNGKSVFSSMAVIHLQSLGYEAYWLALDDEDAYGEFEKIADLDQKSVFIIENYHLHFQLISKINLQKPKKSLFIFTARTVTHEIQYARLQKSIGGSFCEIDLNMLDKNEIESFSKILNMYGLDTREPNEIEKSISRDQNSSLSHVLIDILNAPNIKKKYQNLLDEIDQKKGYHHYVVVIFVFNLLQLDIEPRKLVDILNSDEVSNTAFKTNIVIKQLLNFDENKIKAKSPILSKFIIRGIIDPTSIVSSLIRIMKSIDKNTSFDQYYRDVFSSLMMYKNLNLIISCDRSPDLVLYYYGELKNLKSARSHPLFWLQYAIASHVHFQFDMADLFFKAAYREAEQRPKYDTYQIDNHYAQFLLKLALHNTSDGHHMDRFKEAHKIAMSQLSTDIPRYPLRIVKLYRKFYDTFFPIFNAISLQVFVSSCKDVLEKIKSSSRTNEHGIVQNLVVSVKSDLEHIISRH